MQLKTNCLMQTPRFLIWKGKWECYYYFNNMKYSLWPKHLVLDYQVCIFAILITSYEVFHVAWRGFAQMWRILLFLRNVVCTFTSLITTSSSGLLLLPLWCQSGSPASLLLKLLLLKLFPQEPPSSVYQSLCRFSGVRVNGRNPLFKVMAPERE